jgi:hypothetical protein
MFSIYIYHLDFGTSVAMEHNVLQLRLTALESVRVKRLAYALLSLVASTQFIKLHNGL